MRSVDDDAVDDVKQTLNELHGERFKKYLFTHKLETPTPSRFPSGEYSDDDEDGPTSHRGRRASAILLEQLIHSNMSGDDDDELGQITDGTNMGFRRASISGNMRGLIMNMAFTENVRRMRSMCNASMFLHMSRH